MQEGWVDDARALAGSIAGFTGVDPEEDWLTDYLVRFVFRPGDPSSAPMWLVASSVELLFAAGCGARFELGDPDDASLEVVKLARAVALGGLSERLRFGRVQFRIELEDGGVASGSSGPLGSETPPGRGWHRYAPYPTRCG